MDLANFYLENSNIIQDKKRAEKQKKAAKDTFLLALQKFDQLKLAKDKNGAALKLDRKEYNAKLHVL